MRTTGLVLATTLLVAGCTLNTDYFSEYRGKNLLSTHDFATWSVPTANTKFVTWAQASDLSSNGLNVGPDGISAAYRLEIKNLIPDGDFETEASGATAFSKGFWLPTGTSTVAINTSQTVQGTAGVALDNKSAYWSANVGDTLVLTLAKANGTGALDVNGIGWSTGSYRFRFDFVNAATSTGYPANLDFSGISSLTADNAGAWSTTSKAWVASSWSRDSTFSKAFTLTSTTEPTVTLTLGDKSHQPALVMDNVRLVRTDLDAGATLNSGATLSLATLSSTSLPLLPGSKTGAYTFTVYVHDDPTADQTSTSPAHASNRMEPSGLTLTIYAAVKSGTGTYQHFFPRSGWSTWTKLTASLGFDFVDSDSALAGNTLTNGNALVIKLTPTNTYDTTTLGPDAGSLLVSEPVFQYNP